MRPFRFVVVTLLSLLTLAAAPALAEDSEKAASADGPLRILEDCVVALQGGDFECYVDHLSAEEQKFQAGYALFIASMLSQSVELGAGLFDDPKTFLMARALSDLVKQHTVEESGWDAQHQAAGEARQKILGQAMISALMQADVAQSPYMTTPAIGVRQACINSTGILKDHRQFLIATLAGAAEPVVVTGEEPKEPVNSAVFVDLAKAYQTAKWTLFTRGDIALAVMVAPKNDGPPTPSAAAPAAANYFTVAITHIEFRKIEGRWKIDRLVPTSTLMPGVAPSANQHQLTGSPVPPASYDPFAAQPSPVPPQYAPPQQVR